MTALEPPGSQWSLNQTWEEAVKHGTKLVIPKYNSIFEFQAMKFEDSFRLYWSFLISLQKEGTMPAISMHRQQVAGDPRQGPMFHNIILHSIMVWLRRGWRHLKKNNTNLEELQVYWRITHKVHTIINMSKVPVISKGRVWFCFVFNFIYESIQKRASDLITCSYKPPCGCWELN